MHSTHSSYRLFIKRVASYKWLKANLSIFSSFFIHMRQKLKISTVVVHSQNLQAGRCVFVVEVPLYIRNACVKGMGLQLSKTSPPSCKFWSSCGCHWALPTTDFWNVLDWLLDPHIQTSSILSNCDQWINMVRQAHSFLGIMIYSQLKECVSNLHLHTQREGNPLGYLESRRC